MTAKEKWTKGVKNKCIQIMPQTLLHLPLDTCSWRDSRGGQAVLWLRLHAPNAGGPGLIPDRGTRSHMPQLKILHAAARRSSTPQLRLSTAKSIRKNILDFPGGSAGNKPACQCRQMQEMQVRSLSYKDPMEKEMATHSSILAWRIRWTEEPAGYSAWVRKGVGHNLVTKQQNPVPFPVS